MYLRSSPPSSSEETGMGNSDIFLGGIKVMPDFTVRSLSSFFDYVVILLETRADHG